MRRVHVIIRGKVQGVFFRANIKKRALALGLTGWVRNNSKDVELVIEGEEEKVKDILEFCAIGPEAAQVKEISIGEEAHQREFSNFEIRY